LISNQGTISLRGIFKSAKSGAWTRQRMNQNSLFAVASIAKVELNLTQAEREKPLRVQVAE